MQRAPLARDFSKGARVHNAVFGDAFPGIAGDVADGIATGLYAVHVHAGEQVHHIGSARDRDPVELHIGARGEVTVTVLKTRRGQAQARLRGLQRVLRGLRLGQQFRAGLVKLAGNVCQHAQLLAAEFAIRHCRAQHGCITLNVPTVLQAQGQHLLIAQLAFLPALELIAELFCAQADELLVEIGILVHGKKRK